MATIQSTLALQDKMSPAFSAINKAMNSTLTAMRSIKGMEIGPEFAKAAADVKLAENAINNFNAGLGETPPATQKAGEGFTIMKGLAIQAITAIARTGREMLGNFLEFGDSMINISARLNLIAGEQETVAGLQQEIFMAAQRSRGSYEGMTDSVAKLGAQARNAFGSNQEIIAFSELLNKTFVTAGTSAQGMESVMYNLTQAMGSGVLRGQDLNAVMSNTPQILQYIADYMEVPMGQIRSMASDGELSASVISAAMFAAAGDINAKFESMPQTFEQTTTMMSNQFKFAFSEMGIAFNQFMSGQIQGGMTWLIDNFDSVANAAVIMGTVLAGVAIGFAVYWAIMNWPITLTIAAIVLLGAILSEFGITADQILGFVGGLFGTLYGIIYNGIAYIWNRIATFVEFFANVWTDPIGSVQRLFIGLFDNILGIVESVAGAIGNLLGQDWGGAISGFRSKLQSFAESTYGADAVRIGRMEFKGLDETAMSGANLLSGAGKSLLDGVEKLRNTMESGSGAFDPTMVSSTAGGKALNVKNTEPVKIDSEDIKMLLDISTMKYQVHYQQLTPQIALNIDTIRESADINQVMEVVADWVAEAAESRLVTG